MNAALWMLLGLQLKSYLRFFTRSLSTVKGALLALIGLVLVGFWLSMVALSSSEGRAVDPQWLLTNGPLILLAYCLFQVLFSASESTIYFSPAEVQFLFTGPFTRRQILLYKIVLLTLLTLPVPLLFALMLRHHAGSWLSAVVAMTLGILFLNLFTIAANLTVDLVGAALYGRARKLALLGLLLGVAVVVSLGGGMPDWGKVGEQFARIGESSLLQTLVWPLRWFFELFLARDVVSFLVALVMSLAVDLAMLFVVFALDRNFLEVSAGNSARVYARIQQIRRGQTALAVGGDSASWTLPDFPYWGGVGPIFWRQMMQALRGIARLAMMLGLLALLATLGMFRPSGGGDDGGARLLATSVGVLVWLTIFLTILMPFDFRGDIDRMAQLKSLPVPTWALAIGQLLTPTVVTTLFHWIVLGGLGLLAWQQGEAVSPGPLLALAFLFPSFNFLMYAIENLLFLIFPMRLTQNTPGDFQSVGRNVLLTLSKMLLLLLVVGLAAGLGFWVYATLGQNIYLALGVAWMVLTLAGIALIPPIMVAFHHFDVGRDTPP